MRDLFSLMKALVVGNGAREHIIAEKLAESSELYAYMGRKNPAIAKLCKKFWIGALDDFENIKRRADGMDIVFIGPEEPLVGGIADYVDNVVGPTKIAAMLEGDKSFCRQFMREKIGFGYPEYRICSKYEEAEDVMREWKDFVVKPAGLTGGKGVKVFGKQLKTIEEAKEYIKSLLKSGKVVIEERLEGEEFTLQAFCDGKNLIPMPLVQDHKYAYEGDEGPMTGGMGSYSAEDHLLPFLEKKDSDEALRIMKKTIAAVDYKGVLYGGFMSTSNGVKLLEYNVRFGDPEAINVLSLLKDDLSEICMKILDGKLGSVEFEKCATVCKYLVPKGYPDNLERGMELSIKEPKRAKLYYASVCEINGRIYTTGSRALALLGKGGTIDEAEEMAEEGASEVKTDGLWYRRDIGKRELIEKRIEHMRSLA
jgi:phosphoribosylamine--glycine ligase